MGSKYLLYLWCPDCMGDHDTQGCFGGGTELQEKTFDTLPEAVNYGWEITEDVIWEFYVEHLGEKVFQSNKLCFL